MMSLLTPTEVQSFLSDVNLAQTPPSSRFGKSTAPKIQTRFGESKGKMKERVCFNKLTDERFKIAAFAPLYSRPLFDNYVVTQVTGNDHPLQIWINTESVVKRFDLPKDVIVNNVSNFNRIVRLVQEKQLFLNPDEDSGSSDEHGTALVPLLPLKRTFGPLIPLEQMVKIAQNNNRCYRLSKRCYNLAKSIDVCPGGFIAFDTGEFIGQGGNVRVKMSITPDKTRLVRRCYRFNLSDPGYDEVVFKIIKIFNEFKNKVGVLDTLATMVYENKNGKCKFVTFHPFYDRVFREGFYKILSVDNRLQIAHQLLQGLESIAKKGIHRDLSYDNILHSFTTPFKAVIADLENFKYHNEGEDKILNPFDGPETHGTKREVWDLGKVMYYLLNTQMKINRLPWDELRTPCTQETLNEAMQSSGFSQTQEALLRGMLAPDPEVRWTAKEALKYFETHIVKKKGNI